ncbi:TrkA domain-containing protein [Arcobacter venerupis]|uniref:TrkA domain-containing protein n=1 Tax=Arcobacter venerupis TaxID=1054033 RepID=A0AAE7E5M9_9BACT|nr:potassium channel protein [Arcobacter venerupis]QKF67991.1 TrkA domain-containing protein [Arcobacter venerupis]RWS48296.1 potassium transporter TrkA [Arcobacter venerupis]
MRNNSLFIVLQKMRIPFLVIIITYTIAIIGLILIQGVDANGNPTKMSIFDAFYFISYTATTIGFGETPYTFTYPQRIWVTFSIYITVLGWFYGIGSLVSLLQDKLFIQEMQRTKFLRQIKNLNERFIIVLGYNQITKKIIIKALEQGVRSVVIEKDKLRINDLILENFTPTVPVLYSETYSVRVLEAAGITKRNCKAIVSLFEDDALNLKTTLIAKSLNKNVKVAVKSTTKNHTENLKDLDAQIIVNPFSIISSEINMALIAPNLFKIEKWLYKLGDLNSSLPLFPKGLYIICGYGRMGKKIFEKLNDNNIDVKLIEIKKNRDIEFTKNEISHLVFGDADDKELLVNIGINQAVAIVAATDDDTTNLSILATAKKLNPLIMTIVRENDLADDFLFRNANIDHIFTPSKIVVNKVTNALVNPLSDIFLRQIIKKDNIWASKLINRLVQDIDECPVLLEFEIAEFFAPEICKYLLTKEILFLDIFATSLYNHNQKNNVVPLLLQRDNDIILTPEWEYEIKIGDKLLLACDAHAKNDVEYICQNNYEFYYALTGKEKLTIFKGIK